MKRIVVCSDGTWNSPESPHPTNVMLLARAVAPTASGGEKQTVFYDWGVGSDRLKMTGGLSGAGIDKNVMDCYRFIVHNYAPGDEIFLFGYSRGAYTVRSLAGFIRNCGVLKREHEGLTPEAYALYRKRTKKSSPDETEATRFRKKHAVADRTEIAFLGVWDTVGSLGIPVPFWGTLGAKEYLFHDTEPSSIIRCARHAVAIDEAREDFEPTLWDDKRGVDLRQVWFAGVHSDVGGGTDLRELADYACDWILSEAESKGLETEGHLRAHLRPDPRMKIRDSRRGIFRARAAKHREMLPGDVVDLLKRGRELPRVLDQPLIHKSVKLRCTKLGSDYRSPALQRVLDAVGGDWSRLTVVG